MIVFIETNILLLCHMSVWSMCTSLAQFNVPHWSSKWKLTERFHIIIYLFVLEEFFIVLTVDINKYWNITFVLVFYTFIWRVQEQSNTNEQNVCMSVFIYAIKMSVCLYVCK